MDTSDSGQRWLSNSRNVITARGDSSHQAAHHFNHRVDRILRCCWPEFSPLTEVLRNRQHSNRRVKRYIRRLPR
jgi:hypothetical protein